MNSLLTLIDIMTDVKSMSKMIMKRSFWDTIKYWVTDSPYQCIYKTVQRDNRIKGHKYPAIRKVLPMSGTGNTAGTTTA